MPKKPDPLFRNAFNTLNCLLWPVVALTVLGSLDLKSLFHFPQRWEQYLSWAEFMVKTSLTLVITAFVHGFFVDLASGQDLLQSKAAFLRNLRMFLKTAFWTFFLPFPFHFAAFAVFGPVLPFNLVMILLSPLIIFIWLKVVFLNKFPEKIPKRPSLLSSQGWLVFTALSLVYYAVGAIFFFVPDHMVILRAAGILLLTYLHLWTFLMMTYHVIGRFSLRPAQNPCLKEIYLVNPPSGGIVLGSLSLAVHRYPFVFAILKALTPKGYVFKEFNQVIWRNNYYVSGKLVAITCFSSNCIEAYRIAKEFRKKGSRVVMGGPHVTAFPQEALEFCDAVVVGPAEGVWERVIRDHEAGCMQGIYAGPPTDSAYEKVLKFLLTQPPSIISYCLEIARGCKYNCYFCGAGHSKTGHHRHPPEDVVELIRKARTHNREVIFFDDNIFLDPVCAKELFKAIKPLNIRWAGSSSIDIGADPEALKLCKESGCHMLLIGYEIFPGSKEPKKGKFALADDYLHLSRNIQKAGIGIKAHFIYGFETDDFKTFWKMWWFALRLSPLLTTVGVLTPVPNSRFYTQIEKEDRFINLNWSKYSFFGLVHQHPSVNNSLLRSGWILIMLFFLMTTTKLGILTLLNLIAIGMLFSRTS
jgi:hypothetical protein